MQVKDLFVHPIDREITTVIKVDQIEEGLIAEELQEYVVTDHIEENLLDFLERYTATRAGRPGAETDKVGVWISGFFGSGKSHFAKILSHLLENPEVQGRAAIEWFLDRVAGSPRRGEIEGQLMQVRNFFDNRTLMFQIKSEQDLINPDSISEIMYRKYLESRGLSRTPWVGRLELELIAEGRYSDFKAAIQDRRGQRWEQARQRYLTVRSDMVHALCQVMPETYSNPEAADKALDDIQASLEMGPARLAEELAEYVEQEDRKDPGRSTHLVFIIDEMGQFIGDDGDKLLELQSVAEQFGIAGRGKLWLIVTAQEALEDVIAGVRRKRADYAKIIDRFDTRLEMTSENIEKVLEERILKKRETAEPTLQGLYLQHQGLISRVASLAEANRRVIVPDEERFVNDYPFLPFQFELMQDAFANIRAKGGRADQLTGGERSMLGVTQGVLKSPETGFGTSDVGRMVTLDEIYDQIESEVPGSDRRSINQVPERIEAGPVEPIRVLKILFVLNHVLWIPRTLDNVTRMLVADVDEDFATFRSRVKDALDRLIDGRYVVAVDEQYKYLSAAERDVEEEIAAARAKNNDVRREARRMLGDLFSDVGRLNYERGTALFDIRVRGDEEEISRKGDITLEVYSPIYEAFGNVDPAYIRDLISTSEDQTVYWFSGDVTDLVPDFKRLIRMDAVIRRREGQRDQSPEEIAVLREKRREMDLLEGRLKSALGRALYTGTLVYQGDATPLDGKTTNLNRIYNRELSKIIPHVYTKLHLAEVKVSETSIEEMLTTSARNLPDVEPELQIWDESQHIRTHAPAVSEIVEELERRTDLGQDTSGRALMDHFSGVPYGWNPVVVRIVLAALFRAGLVSLKLGGKYYRDHNLKAARNAFTRSTDFKKANFEYDPMGGLSLEERKEARRRIDIVFDRKVDDTTNTLAKTLDEELSALRGQNERLRLRAEGAQLPAPDILYEGESVLRRILDKGRPSDVVKAFLENQEIVDRLKTYLERLERFVEEGRLQTYRYTTRLLSAIDRARDVNPELFDDEVRRHVEDMRTIAQNRQVVDKWSSYLNHYQRVKAAYQSTYTDLYQQRTRTYATIREQVAQFGEVPATITRYIVEDPDGWTEDGVCYAHETAAISDVYLQIQSAEQVRQRAIEELQEARKSDGDAGDGPAPPVYIRAADYLPQEPISDEAELDTAIEKLKRRVRDVLQEGRRVLLG